MPIPISIQLYTVRELLKQDYLGTIKQIADIGYDAIEGGPPKGMSDADFKKFLDDLGLKLSSGWAFATSENINAVVERAQFYGYRTLTGGLWIDDFKTIEAIKITADKFEASAELLTPHGLQMCVHNHWFEFDLVEGQLAIQRLLELAGPRLAMELDIYWANNFGTVDVPEFVTTHKSRIPLMHVKDGPLVKGQPHVAVGAGQLDVKTCLAAADPDVLRYLVVELDEYVGGHANVMEAVKASYDWLVKNGFGNCD